MAPTLDPEALKELLRVFLDKQFADFEKAITELKGNDNADCTVHADVESEKKDDSVSNERPYHAVKIEYNATLSPEGDVQMVARESAGLDLKLEQAQVVAPSAVAGELEYEVSAVTEQNTANGSLSLPEVKLEDLHSFLEELKKITNDEIIKRVKDIVRCYNNRNVFMGRNESACYAAQ